MASPAGQFNTFLPQVTKNLIVNYSRNPKDFAFNQLLQIVPVDKMIGRFPKVRAQEASRLLDEDFRRFADGGMRPVSDFNKMQFDWKTYTCERWAESQPVGDLAVDQADWPVLEAIAAQVAERAMLFRAKKFYDILTTSGSYASGHADTATNFGGGAWASATTSNLNIKKTLQGVGQKIEKATNGVVRYSHLTLAVSPTVANVMAASAEISENVIQSPFANMNVTGEGNLVSEYGLPSKLYGMNVVVDPTIETTTNLNASGTATAAYEAGVTYAYVIAKKGDLVNNTGIASPFGSIAAFVYKNDEMKTEIVQDPFNLRKVVSVIDNFHIMQIAEETMCRITIGS